MEDLPNAEEYFATVMKKVKRHLELTYEVSGWTDHIEFLTKMAMKRGKLLKGGAPDLQSVAKCEFNMRVLFIYFFSLFLSLSLSHSYFDGLATW